MSHEHIEFTDIVEKLRDHNDRLSIKVFGKAFPSLKHPLSVESLVLSEIAKRSLRGEKIIKYDIQKHFSHNLRKYSFTHVGRAINTLIKKKYIEIAGTRPKIRGHGEVNFYVPTYLGWAAYLTQNFNRELLKRILRDAKPKEAKELLLTALDDPLLTELLRSIYLNSLMISALKEELYIYHSPDTVGILQGMFFSSLITFDLAVNFSFFLLTNAKIPHEHEYTLIKRPFLVLLSLLGGKIEKLPDIPIEYTLPVEHYLTEKLIKDKLLGNALLNYIKMWVKEHKLVVREAEEKLPKLEEILS